ncbi:MAG: hypothetical protein ABR555_07790 [Pyrinomonadaceae bacterium]
MTTNAPRVVDDFGPGYLIGLLHGNDNQLENETGTIPPFLRSLLLQVMSCPGISNVKRLQTALIFSFHSRVVPLKRAQTRLIAANVKVQARGFDSYHGAAAIDKFAVAAANYGS